MRSYRPEFDGIAADSATASPIVPNDADILAPPPNERRCYASQFVDAEVLQSDDGKAEVSRLRKRKVQLQRVSGVQRTAVGVSALSVVVVLASITVLTIFETAGLQTTRTEGSVVQSDPEARFAFAPVLSAPRRLVSVSPVIPSPQPLRLTLAPTLISKGELIVDPIVTTGPSRVAGLVQRRPSAARQSVSPAAALPIRNPRFGRIALGNGEHRLTSARLAEGERIIAPMPRLRRTVVVQKVFRGVNRSALGRGIDAPLDATPVPARPTLRGQSLPDWAASAFEAQN